MATRAPSGYAARMEYAGLIFIHVLGAIFWAGGAIHAGFFLIPSVLEAGPAGGAVMAGLVKRKFPLIMTIVALVVVLTGVRLYMLRFSAAWATSAEGIVLALGGLLAIGGLAIGVFVQKPRTEKLGALGAAVKASGGPPTAEQAAEIAALQSKIGRTAKVIAFHAIGAAVLMMSHRLVLAAANG